MTVHSSFFYKCLEQFPIRSCDCHNTAVKNGGRCLAYNVSKYEQSQSRFKEIMAAEERASPPKEECWISLSMLKVKMQ